MNHNESATDTIRSLETYPPKFSTMQEIGTWFDRNYCGIRKLTIVAAPTPIPGERVEPEYSQQRLQGLASTLSSAHTQKAEWLRRDGNEEWYGQRLAIVHGVWNELKQRHDEVVNALNDHRRELDQELVAMQQRLVNQERESMALADKKEELSRALDITRNTVIQIVGGFKASKFNFDELSKWARDAVKSFRELLAKELKP